MITFVNLETPVGTLTPYVSSEGGSEQLVAILWNGEPAHRYLEGAVTAGDNAGGVLRSVIEELRAYFDGDLQHFSVPIAPKGTDFQRAAWDALTKIPYGETSTYGRQAERVGKPTAVRAIGAANGRNPIPIVVPCHRVIGSNGSLTGFAGGLQNKLWLLEHEQRVAFGADHPPVVHTKNGLSIHRLF